MNDLARHYTRFRVADRLLLSGHSHQAWPDVAFEGQQEAWLDAAEQVDDKWERAAAKADAVKAGYRALLDDPSGLYALAGSTHDLVVRWLSALPLRAGAHLVTTDGEFHSLYRQLRRLEEEGVRVSWVAAEPAENLAERLLAEVKSETVAMLSSAVFFNNARIFFDLPRLAAECKARRVPLLIDAYHALGAVPFSVRDMQEVFVVGGGYKYLQLGEGNAFLRYPKDCALRPVITGWMADYGALAKPRSLQIAYPSESRFDGATYDPTSHYRAARVFEFFRTQGLTAQRLRHISQQQTRLILERAKALGARSLVPICADNTKIGGFVGLRSPRASELCAALHAKGVLCDSRADVLRLGPAPYLSDTQIHQAMDRLESLL